MSDQTPSKPGVRCDMDDPSQVARGCRIHTRCRTLEPHATAAKNFSSRFPRPTYEGYSWSPTGFALLDLSSTGTLAARERQAALGRSQNSMPPGANRSCRLQQAPRGGPGELRTLADDRLRPLTASKRREQSGTRFRPARGSRAPPRRAHPLATYHPGSARRRAGPASVVTRARKRISPGRGHTNPRRAVERPVLRGRVPGRPERLVSTLPIPCCGYDHNWRLAAGEGRRGTIDGVEDLLTLRSTT